MIPSEKPRLFTVTLSENPTEREKEWCELLAKAYHERIVESGEYDVIKKMVDEKQTEALDEMLYGRGRRINEQVTIRMENSRAIIKAKHDNIAPYTREELMEGREL